MERKYYYGRTLANKNEASFCLNGGYSFFLWNKNGSCKQNLMSKLDAFLWLTLKCYSEVSRSSYWRWSVKKGVRRNFAKFTGKHKCQSLFCNFIKTEVFSCEFCEISKNSFPTEHLKTTAEFLQIDIDKFKECQTNDSTKKIHLWRKKGKHGMRETNSNVPNVLKIVFSAMDLF